jgi:hypothetical protein
MSSRTALHRSILFVAALLFAATAQAVVPVGLFRAYLASTGSDTNDCTRPTPCRLLPAALTAVADGGEIWMLDSANYNTATVDITKSVSILAVPGAVGSVVAPAGPAINITAAGLKVALRNLVIVSLAGGAATHGVYMTGASTLLIENSLIANLPGNGVFVVGTGMVKVTNSIFRTNSGYAVYLQNGASGEISGTQMLANFGGVVAYGATSTTTVATVSDSVISGAYEGVLAYTGIAGATVRIFVTRSTIEGASYALDSQSNGVGSTLVTVSGSTITNNNYAWAQGNIGSVIESAANNLMRGNSFTLGSLTLVGLQ